MGVVAGLYGRHDAIHKKQIELMLETRDLLEEAWHLNVELAQSDRANALIPLPTSLGENVRQKAMVDATTQLTVQISLYRRNFGEPKIGTSDWSDLQICEATLANVENRFPDAQSQLPLETPDTTAGVGAIGENRLVRLLNVRGDTQFGLQKWAEAIKAYERALALRPGLIFIHTRLAEAFQAIGNATNATAFQQRAVVGNLQRGDDYLLLRQPDKALTHYRAAEGLLRNHGTDLSPGLAPVYDRAGNAQFMKGSPAAAQPFYEKAAEQRTSSTNRLDSAERLLEMAAGERRLGDSLFAQLKLQPAIDHYGRSLNLYARLGQVNSTPSPPAPGDEVALTHNNRSIAFRAQKRLNAALADLDEAVAILTPMVKPAQPQGLSEAKSMLGEIPHVPMKMDVVMAFSGTELEIETKARALQPNQELDREVLLTSCLGNRGYTQLALGKVEPALKDIESCIALQTRRLEEGGYPDLALDLAKTLTSAAWIYATHPENQIRNGLKSLDMASKACLLNGWSRFDSMAALAAASAESKQFADAVRWQERAIAMAPPGNLVALRSQLALYTASKAYRIPSKAGSASP